MWFIAIAVLLGALVGRLRGGSASEIASTEVRWVSVLLLGLAARLLTSGLDLSGASLPLVASFLFIGAFAVRNLHLVGMPIFLFGLLLNFVPLAVNDGMPVRPDAVVAANVAGAGELDVVDLGAGRHLETDGDSFTVLGDIVPVPFLRAVVSFGDLILGVGLADVVTNLMLVGRRRRGLPERRSSSEPDDADAPAIATSVHGPASQPAAEIPTQEPVPVAHGGAGSGEERGVIPEDWREVDPEPPAVRIFDIEAEEVERADPAPAMSAGRHHQRPEAPEERDEDELPTEWATVVVSGTDHPSGRAGEAAAAALRADTG